MNRKFLFSAAALLLAVSTVSWAQEQDGAPRQRKKAQVVTARVVRQRESTSPENHHDECGHHRLAHYEGYMSKDPHRKPIPGLPTTRPKQLHSS